MLATLKSELRKLLSVRSTYIIILVVLALIALFTFLGTSASTYEEAVCKPTGEVLYSRDYTDPRLDGTSPEEVCDGPVSYTTKTVNNLPEHKLLANTQEAMSILSIFVAVVVVLQMAHEFRYNTINYTLTISNSRSKVLLTKLIVSTLLTVVATLLAIGVSVAVTMVAVNAKDLILPTQDYNWMYILLRHIGFMLAFVLFFLGVTALVRNLVASIVAIFLIPTIDGISSILLATRDIEPTRILPFSAHERFGNIVLDVTGNQGNAAEFMVQTLSGQATALVAGAVTAAWLVGLWVITWVLFLKRDAN